MTTFINNLNKEIRFYSFNNNGSEYISLDPGKSINLESDKILYYRNINRGEYLFPEELIIKDGKYIFDTINDNVYRFNVIIVDVVEDEIDYEEYIPSGDYRYLFIGLLIIFLILISVFVISMLMHYKKTKEFID